MEIALDTFTVPARLLPRPASVAPVGRLVIRRQRHEFDRFFLEHYDSVLRSVTFACGDRERAADATQEAFIRAYHRWQRLRRYENAGAWVRRIAINVTRDEHRSATRRSRREAGFEPPIGGLPGPDPASRFDVSPALDALRALPDRQRAIAALYFLDDLSVADISETLAIAEGTVRFHLSQARTRLKADLRLDEHDDRDDSCGIEVDRAG